MCISGLSVQEDTYSGGSICESGLLVHRLQHRATYYGGSICECGLSVHSVTDCSHRAITMQLTVVEVLVKVACRPQQSQTKGTELFPCYLSQWKYL